MFGSLASGTARDPADRDVISGANRLLAGQGIGQGLKNFKESVKGDEPRPRMGSLLVGGLVGSFGAHAPRMTRAFRARRCC